MGNILGISGLAPTNIGALTEQAIGPLNGGAPPPPVGDEGVLVIAAADDTVNGGAGFQDVSELDINLDTNFTLPAVFAFEYVLFLNINSGSRQLDYDFISTGATINEWRSSQTIVDPGAVNFVNNQGAAFIDGIGSNHLDTPLNAGGFANITMTIRGYADVQAAANDIRLRFQLDGGVVTINQGSWARWQVEG